MILDGKLNSLLSFGFGFFIEVFKFLNHDFDSLVQLSFNFTFESSNIKTSFQSINAISSVLFKVELEFFQFRQNLFWAFFWD